MKFSLISDIHYAHWLSTGFDPVNIIDNTEQADVLLLAGDIDENIADSCRAVDKISKHYKHVCWCDGNHEHYQSPLSVAAGTDLAEAYFEAKDNIHFMQGKTYVKFGDVAVVGANGWYDFNFWGDRKETEQQISNQYMNDYRLIDFGNYYTADQLANIHVSRLMSVINLLTHDPTIKSIVLFTHTVPHKNGLVGPDHPWAQTNGSFYNSELAKLLQVDVNNKIKVWGFGHTHLASDFVVDKVRYMCYPIGYPFEKGTAAKMLRDYGPVTFEV